MHICETVIRAPAERIWDGLTLAEFTRQYFHATHIASDWKPGSPVEFRYDDGTLVVEGEVIEFERPRRLVYTWHVLYDEGLSREPHSRVAFDIEPVEGGCRLRVTHDEFPPDSAVYEQVSRGWSAIIESLKALLERKDTGESAA